MTLVIDSPDHDLCHSPDHDLCHSPDYGHDLGHSPDHDHDLDHSPDHDHDLGHSPDHDHDLGHSPDHDLVQDPYAKRFMKDEKITKTAYIANSGGLLGLCMGFSLGRTCWNFQHF